MDRAQLIAAMAAAAAPRPRVVSVPAWGGDVHVRSLTVAEVEDQAIEKDDKHRLARAAARVVCDAEGNRLFDPKSDDDIALISQQPWAVLSTVLDAAEKANGLTAEAVEQAGNG